MPSSSLFLRSSATLVSALLLSVASATSNQYYAIDTSYQGSTFFDGFSFFSAADPTHGYVDYLSRSDALAAQLISYGSASPAKMKVDASTPLTPPQNVSQYYNQDGVGRKSVRIESVKTWTHGLIVLDIDHMPTSATDGCGTWPAFWTLGSGTWPQNGEMDIIEGANDQVKNFAAGHTGGADKTRQCSVTNNGGSGDLIYSNCNLYSTDPWGNPTNPTGCKIEDETAASFGKPFNDNKGGVYAMEWTSEYIKTYFFPRGSIPTDIGAGTPDPSKWTAPFGVFSTPCDIDSNYNNMQIIFDTTFCGDFGDATWGSSCAAKTGFDTCAKYVASKPLDFAEAYWQIESLKVYTLKDKPITTSSTSTTLSTTTRSTTKSTTSSSTRSTSSTSSPAGSSSSSSSSSTTTSSCMRSSSTISFTTSSPTSSSTTSYSRSSSTLASSTTASSYTRASSTSASASTTSSSPRSSSTPASSTSTTSSSTQQSSKSSSPILSSTTSTWTTSTSTVSKSDSTSSSSSATSASSSWVDWPIDPTFATTTVTSSSTSSYDSWADWSSSSTSTPAVSTSMTTSATYDPSHTWADWPSSSSTPAASTSTSTTSTNDPTHTWADWESSSTSSTPAISANTSSYDPSYTWADWQVSAAAASYSATGTGAQYYPISSAASAPVSGASAAWGGSIVPATASMSLTTMTVQPTPSIPAAGISGWSAAAASASGSGVSHGGYGGSSGSASGSPVTPDVAAYTGGAVKTGMGISVLALMAVAPMLVL